MPTIEGIDVSAMQGLVDWNKVKAAGVSFAILKATEGVDFVDKMFAQHVAGARAAGMPFGAYHYLHVRKGRPQDADKQAEQFCDIYLKSGCTLLPALDCEETGNKGCTFDEWLIAIRMWVAHVEKRLGIKPVIYTYPGFWSGLGPAAWKADDLAECKLWIAHYTPAPHPSVPKPWTGWFMWQYAADAGVIGRVDGVVGNVDRSKCLGSLEDLKYHPIPEDPPTLDEGTRPVTSPTEPPTVNPVSSIPIIPPTIIPSPPPVPDVQVEPVAASGIMWFITFMIKLIMGVFNRSK
jgi:lysozyme